MTTFQAITMIEDTPQATEEQYIQAFQSLIDSGACWQLQGWYGRTAMRLIESGHCSINNEEGE